MDREEELLEKIDTLEAELASLRPAALAAREAYAFLSGKRPGFAPTYAYDVLRSALEPNKPRKARMRKRMRSA